MTYEILDHVSDLKIRVFGKTQEEVFINALLAMTENLEPEVKKNNKQKKIEIEIESFDLKTLLVDFLSEALYLIQTNKEIYKINNLKIKNNKLKASLLGQKIEKIKQDIKAVTYYQLDVVKKEDTWQATILFDI